MKRNKLAEQIREQQELVVSLQAQVGGGRATLGQVDTFVTRTFPTLG